MHLMSSFVISDFPNKAYFFMDTFKSSGRRPWLQYDSYKLIIYIYATNTSRLYFIFPNIVLSKRT